MKKIDDIREVFKTVKHRKPTVIYCPRCASPKIHLSSSLAVWLTPKQYLCDNCGYVGIVVMELEKDENATENDQTKKQETKTET
jgi:predicted RNA-binding Zn-ribbon protein involved in translation (DUF1610 family)